MSKVFNITLIYLLLIYKCWCRGLVWFWPTVVHSSISLFKALQSHVKDLIQIPLWTKPLNILYPLLKLRVLCLNFTSSPGSIQPSLTCQIDCPGWCMAWWFHLKLVAVIPEKTNSKAQTSSSTAAQPCTYFLLWTESLWPTAWELPSLLEISLSSGPLKRSRKESCRSVAGFFLWDAQFHSMKKK